MEKICGGNLDETPPDLRLGFVLSSEPPEPLSGNKQPETCCVHERYLA